MRSTKKEDEAAIESNVTAEPKTATKDEKSSIKTARINTAWDRKKLQENNEDLIIWPWSKRYRVWWGLTVACAIFTVFTETYGIAFSPSGLYPYNDASSIIEYFLLSIFLIDIIVTFHLVYYNEQNELVFCKKLIARNYLRGMFWFDLAGVFPFYYVALAIAGELGDYSTDSTLASNLALFRLVRLVRLRRMKQLFDILEYNTRVSFMWLTLTRNFCFILTWSHFAACVFYFIARQSDFHPEETWIGGSLEGLNGFERYVTSLYWSVVTFTTVGYGDYSPVNSVEQIWGMIYMLLNIIAHSWIIGTMTLLIVKHDEKTSVYRESIQTLNQYSTMHNFTEKMHKSLKTQLKLEFNNRDISDEQVLAHFPTEVRRKVLRKLYLPSLMQTSLMKGIRQQFVDAFLTSCNVEILSSGEEILQRGSTPSDLYLLVAGTIKLVPFVDRTVEETQARGGQSTFGGTSVADSELRVGKFREIGSGEFVNEIAFLTGTPQYETVRTKTVCKTLTISRSSYKMLAADHPGSVGKVLQNLLCKVEEMAAEVGFGSTRNMNLQKSLAALNAGSEYYGNSMREVQNTVASIQTEASLTAVQDLIKMHVNKQKDDHTTRFLFAASRNDTVTISLMCDQGFDPNNADYDKRTALMVSAMKGNTEAVSKILEFQANPNIVDMHGSSALYEAARNGHEETMELLLKHGAELCMDHGQAASRLCQAVFDGDIPMLRRLLKARISVNSSDYDKRTAAHIAIAEGNVAALKVLVEFGADLTLQDRWGNTVDHEAKRLNAGQLLEYLDLLREKQKQ